MITKLIKANFRKDITQMISFILIVILSATMLQVGITLLLGYSQSQKQILEDINSADIVMHFGENLTDEQYLEVQRYIESLSEIDKYETVSFVRLGMTTKEEVTDSKDVTDDYSVSLDFMEYPADRDIDKVIINKKAEGTFKNPIYMSTYNYNMHFADYSLGDDIELFVDGKVYVFQLAGLYDTLIMDDFVYIDPSQLYEIEQDYERNRTDILIKVSDECDVSDLNDLITDEMAAKHGDIRFGISCIDEYIMSDLIMVNVISAILCAFSIIITIVVMVIIYFRIVNSIEQNITNIGALKALGCTGSQIRTAQVLEFTITAVAGVGISTVLSVFFMGPLTTLMSSVTELSWDAHLLPVAIIAAFALFIVLTVVMSLISTRMINRLDPIVALRFGFQSHSFKKNHLPLATTTGPLVWLMALKSAIRNKKQNIMVVLIMIAVGISSAFIAYFAYNICYKPINLYSFLQISNAHGQVMIDSGDDDPVSEILTIPHVTECYTSRTAISTVEGKNTSLVIFDDCSAVTSFNLIDGRIPIYSDEIAYSATKASSEGHIIGDYVTIPYNGIEKDFIITGLVQGVENMGGFVIMNKDGADLLGIDAGSGRYSFMVDKEDSKTVQSVIKEIENRYGNRLSMYLNLLEGLKTDEVIISSLIITILVTIIAILVILLTMALLVKTIIIRKQKEFGIQKALGFTSSQIRRQLMMSMMPCIFIGASCGCVIGLLNANRVLAMMMSSLGTASCHLPIFPWMGIAAIVSVLLISMLFIWLMSGKVKKITAYSLIKE